MTYKQQLADKQARVDELSAELEEILTEIPLLKAVVTALEAWDEEQEEQEPEPAPEPALDPELIRAQELLAKAQGLRSRLSEMKAEAQELNS